MSIVGFTTDLSQTTHSAGRTCFRSISRGKWSWLIIAATKTLVYSTPRVELKLRLLIPECGHVWQIYLCS